MFYDLNVPWTNANDPQLARTLHFLHELGYNVVALNHIISGKIPADLANPIPQPRPIPNLPSNLRILTRLTITLTPDVAQPSNARLAALSQMYDLVALRPTDEKTLSQACSTLDNATIISLDLTPRYSFWFRIKMLNEALLAGKKFEICYAQPLFSGSSSGPSAGAGGGGGLEAARRNFIGNATQLVRATKGRGIILSSEARRAVMCRGPWDVVNLGVVWGLPQEKGVEALSREARACVVNAELQKTSFRGVVGVVYGGEKTAPDEKLGGKDGARKGKGKGSMAEQGVKNNGVNGSTENGAGSNGDRTGAVAGVKRKNADHDGAVAPAAERPMSNRQMKRLKKEAKARGEQIDGADGKKKEAPPVP